MKSTRQRKVFAKLRLFPTLKSHGGTMSTLTQRIGQFTSALEREQIPAKVREKAKVSLLHNLGLGLAGQDLLVAPGHAQSLGEHGPMACARLLISGRPATPETAAFVNAALMHARAQDCISRG